MNARAAPSMAVETDEEILHPSASEKFRPTADEYHAILDQFSHDVRNPLGVLKEYSSLLCDGLLGTVTAEQAEGAHVLWERADDIHILLDLLIAHAKLSNGSLAPVEKIHEIETIVRDVSFRLWERGTRTGNKLTTRIAFPLPDVRCDLTIVRMILRCLCWLAARRAPESSDVWLEASAEPDGRFVTFRVSSQGLRIRPEQARGILSQLRNRSSARPSGTFDFALGIACDLARLMGSSLEVSTGDTGSIMELRLATPGDVRTLAEETRA